MNKDGKCFKYLQLKFPKFSDAKIKKDISAGLDIRTFIKDDQFLSTMTSVEKNAWSSSKSITKHFWGIIGTNSIKDVYGSFHARFTVKILFSTKHFFLPFYFENNWHVFFFQCDTWKFRDIIFLSLALGKFFFF